MQSFANAAYENFKNEQRFFWIIIDKDYEELRKIEGCEKLGDLNATKSDATHIVDFARGVGVPDENIWRYDGTNLETVKAKYNEILKKTKELTALGEEHTLFVYVGGHGISHNEKQLYLFNTDDKHKAFFPIEQKLRYLQRDQGSKIKVMAIYDCCRVPLAGIKGLEGTGRGEGQGDSDDGEEHELQPCRYFHI